MSSRNRNEYLDLPSDLDLDDLDNGYNSEEADRKPALRATKRRRIEREDDESGEEDLSSKTEDVDDDAVFEAARARLGNRVEPHSSAAEDQEDEIEVEDGEEDGALEHDDTRRGISARALPAKSKPSKRQRDPSKTGVIYLSRIPPFMKPSTLRTLLTPHAPKHGLNRLFLTPEPARAHQARVKAGGNKKKSFADGWVEFNSKREAKTAVAALNARIVGGRKGGWYHDDVWNMRYLRGFKWDDLMAQMRAEKVEREGRVRAEIASQGREDRRFVESLDAAKALQGIQETRRRRAERTGGVGEAAEMRGTVFRQNEVRDKRAKESEKKSLLPKTQAERVIGGIF